MTLAIRIAVFALGVAIVLGTLGSAVRTVILPRGIPVKLGAFVFVWTRKLFDLRVQRKSAYRERDQIMAHYAPIALLTLAVTWLLMVFLGYTGMFWALNDRVVREAVTLSGSSLFTLGFLEPNGYPETVLAFSEAALGLTVAALLIAYLPTLYSNFSRREAMVLRLEVRAGQPPSGVEMIERFARIGWLDELDELWAGWEGWFVELEETHTSLPALVFFRSPQPDHSWVTAAGAVLDGAALGASCFPEEHPQADLCLRSGYLALRGIAEFFGIPYERDPQPGDPISVTREEFDQAWDRMAAAGVPLADDRGKAWTAFTGWRVNYDTVLLALCVLVMAPEAPWSSDRAPEFRRVRVMRRSQSTPQPRAKP